MAHKTRATGLPADAPPVHGPPLRSHRGDSGTEQAAEYLESMFRENATPTPETCDQMGVRTGMTRRAVQTWFAGRRARSTSTGTRPAPNPSTVARSLSNATSATCSRTASSLTSVLTSPSLSPSSSPRLGARRRPSDSEYAALTRSLAAAAAAAGSGGGGGSSSSNHGGSYNPEVHEAGITKRGHNPFFQPSFSASAYGGDGAFSMYRTQSNMSDATTVSVDTMTPLCATEFYNPFEFDEHLSSQASDTESRGGASAPSHPPRQRSSSSVGSAASFSFSNIPSSVSTTTTIGALCKPIPCPVRSTRTSRSSSLQSSCGPTEVVAPFSSMSRPDMPRRNTYAAPADKDMSSSGDFSRRRPPRLSTLSTGMSRSKSSMGESSLSSPGLATAASASMSFDSTTPMKSGTRPQPYSRSPLTPLKRTMSNFERSLRLSGSAALTPLTQAEASGVSSRRPSTSPLAHETGLEMARPAPTDRTEPFDWTCTGPLSPISPSMANGLTLKSVDVTKAMRFATERDTQSTVPISPLSSQFANSLSTEQVVETKASLDQGGADENNSWNANGVALFGDWDSEMEALVHLDDGLMFSAVN